MSDIIFTSAFCMVLAASDTKLFNRKILLRCIQHFAWHMIGPRIQIPLGALCGLM